MITSAITICPAIRWKLMGIKASVACRALTGRVLGKTPGQGAGVAKTKTNAAFTKHPLDNP